jgi:hypothetical protein
MPSGRRTMNKKENRPMENRKAIYMILEDDISEKTGWSNYPVLVAELEKEYEELDSGKDKG